MIRSTVTGAVTSTFSIVTENLLKLGSLPLSRFADSADGVVEEFDDPPSTLRDILLRSSRQLYASNPNQTLAHLHQIAHRLFGHADGLNFEVIDDPKCHAKSCTLTITLPNGKQQVFSTEAKYSRKNEAKAAVAVTACQSSAIDFMCSDESVPKDIILPQFFLGPPRKPKPEPLDSALPSLKGSESSRKVSPDSEEDVMEDPLVSEIEECSQVWRGGRVKPLWLYTSDSRPGSGIGCALKIELAPNAMQVYSVEAIYPNCREAKVAVARLAIRQDVLEYIRFGNGLTSPLPPLEPDGSELLNGAKVPPINVHQFYDNLPQPLPEPFGSKAIGELNPIGWLNQTIQTAKACKLSVSFNWTSDPRTGYHGCLLRLNRAEHESISYLAEPRFAKRQDAKTSVSFLAVSQGIGTYIKRIVDTMEEKITHQMRRRASDEILPKLIAEYRAFKPDSHLPFVHDYTDGAHAARLTIDLGNNISKTYRVPPDYKSKSDAKLALILVAAQEGVLEFIRFRGGPIPGWYRSPLASDSSSSRPAQFHLRGIEVLSVKRPAPHRSFDSRKRPKRAEPRDVSKDTHLGGKQAVYHPKSLSTSSLSYQAFPGEKYPVKGRDVKSQQEGPSLFPDVTYRQRRAAFTESGSYRSRSPSRANHSSDAMYPDRADMDARPLSPFRPESDLSSEYPPGQGCWTSNHADTYKRDGAYDSVNRVHSPSISMAQSHYSYYPQAQSRYYDEMPLYRDLPRFDQSPKVLQSRSDRHGSGSDDHTPSTYFDEGSSGIRTARLQPEPVVQLEERKFSFESSRYYTSGRDYRHPSSHSISKDSQVYSFEAPHDDFTPQRMDASRVRDLSPGIRSHPPFNQRQGEWHVREDRSLDRYSRTSSPEDSLDSIRSATSEQAMTLKVTRIHREHSYIDDLYDYCKAECHPTPIYGSETISKSDGSKYHKVWIIMRNERLELPTMFPTIHVGQERVAKLVLMRLKKLARS